jgi:hypothetical protein
VWEKMEEPQIAERLFKLISEYAAPSVIARGISGRDMFYLEDKLTTTTGIKDVVEENYLLLIIFGEYPIVLGNIPQKKTGIFTKKGKIRQNT